MSQLKRAIDGLTASPTFPDQLTSELELLVEPLALLDVRNKEGEGTTVLIQWKGLPFCEATGEEAALRGARFPVFHLEDKVIFWGRGVVMDHTNPGPPALVINRRTTPTTTSTTPTQQEKVEQTLSTNCQKWSSNSH